MKQYYKNALPHNCSEDILNGYSRPEFYSLIHQMNFDAEVARYINSNLQRSFEYNMRYNIEKNLFDVGSLVYKANVNDYIYGVSSAHLEGIINDDFDCVGVYNPFSGCPQVVEKYTDGWGHTEKLTANISLTESHNYMHRKAIVRIAVTFNQGWQNIQYKKHVPYRMDKMVTKFKDDLYAEKGTLVALSLLHGVRLERGNNNTIGWNSDGYGVNLQLIPTGSDKVPTAIKEKLFNLVSRKTRLLIEKLRNECDPEITARPMKLKELDQ